MAGNTDEGDAWPAEMDVLVVALVAAGWLILGIVGYFILNAQPEPKGVRPQ